MRKILLLSLVGFTQACRTDKDPTPSVSDTSIVNDDQLTALRSLLWCQASFLEASFRAVTDTWGTWDAFRRNGLGIDDDRFGAFTEKLLT